MRTDTLGRRGGARTTVALLLAMLALLAALGLAACGGGSSDSAASSDSSSSTDGSTDDSADDSSSDSDSGSATASGWTLSTGAHASDLVENQSFITLDIDLGTLAVSSRSTALSVGATTNGSTPVTQDGSTVITIAKDSHGLAITSSLPSGTQVAYALSGSYAGSITVYSANDFALLLNGATIASTDGPALNIQSTQRAFVVLGSGSSNTLTDTTTWSTRTLADGSEMDLKATLFSEGPVIVSGSGALAITAAAKHAIASDAHVRLREGSVTLTAKKKDGIRANDAFVMDGGTLAITTAKGKGIKVEGQEDDTLALGFIVINDGTLTVNSYDKAVTASWEGDEDGETTSTADDPDPFVTINGGAITITTTGTPYEDSDTSDGDDSLSPEGIESKSTLTLNGGTLLITTTDDALNAGSAIVINGGSIYARSSVNDAVDSNGTLTITGGLLVADGATGAEGGLDTDSGTFKITGGTLVGIGGRNSAVTASATTQNTVSLSSVSSGLLVVRDSAGNVAFAYQMPYSASGVLISSAALTTGSTYTVYKGGSIGSYTQLFQGLYIGASGYTAGTAGRSFTISSVVTAM